MTLDEKEVIKHVKEYGKYIRSMNPPYCVDWNGKLYVAEGTRGLVLQICKDEGVEAH